MIALEQRSATVYWLFVASLKKRDALDLPAIKPRSVFFDDRLSAGGPTGRWGVGGVGGVLVCAR